MKEFQDRKRLKIKKILYSRPALILLVILILLAAHSVWRVWQRSRLVVAERDQLARQVEELAERQAGLEQDLASLQTDRGIEQAIREKFPVVKAGEGVVTVLGATNTAAVGTSSTWWQDLLELFK